MHDAISADLSATEGRIEALRSCLDLTTDWGAEEREELWFDAASKLVRLNKSAKARKLLTAVMHEFQSLLRKISAVSKKLTKLQSDTLNRMVSSCAVALAGIAALFACGGWLFATGALEAGVTTVAVTVATYKAVSVIPGMESLV